MKRDVELLGKKVGELGEDKWKLEEKIRFLEENIGLLNEEIEKKSKVTQYLISKRNINLNEINMNSRKAGMVGSLFRTSDQTLAAEMVAKMEAVLEETVLKNIQLQNDMVTLATETSQVNDRNKKLKEEAQGYKEQMLELMRGSNANHQKETE